MGFKRYRVYRDISNKKAAEEIVKELDKVSEARWHLVEVDTETKEEIRLI